MWLMLLTLHLLKAKSVWRLLAALVVAPSITNNLVQTNIQNNYNNPYNANGYNNRQNNRDDNRDNNHGCPPFPSPCCRPFHRHMHDAELRSWDVVSMRTFLSWFDAKRLPVTASAGAASITSTACEALCARVGRHDDHEEWWGDQVYHTVGIAVLSAWGGGWNNNGPGRWGGGARSVYTAPCCY